MFAIVMCLVLLICTFTIYISMVCMLMVKGMSVVVNVMLSLMIVMNPPPNLCNLSVCTVVRLYTEAVEMNRQKRLYYRPV